MMYQHLPERVTETVQRHPQRPQTPTQWPLGLPVSPPSNSKDKPRW
jgi:hypothetical protein